MATELDERGLIHRVGDQVQARDVMVEAYFRWATNHRRVALVTSTNEEADAINEAIQQRRLEHGDLSLTHIAIGQGEQRILEGDVVQTRRNDRNSDVENRAIWTVRQITALGLDLVSVTDSAEARNVSHDYAASHVHLAYASTVHGIQGETTDASVVGPGVDASGHYVGMTRGRVHNEAIAIARTDAAARDAIANSMLRGIPEVSIEDSVRAARTELSRAARASATNPEGTPAVWNDKVRRPYGNVVDIDRLAEANRQKERDVRDRLERMNDWMHTTKRTLLELDARNSTAAATDHGRNPETLTSAHSKDAQRRLAERYAARAGEHAEFAKDYRTLARATDALEAERSIRASQDVRVRLAEDQVRMGRIAPPGSFAAEPSPGGIRR